MRVFLTGGNGFIGRNLREGFRSDIDVLAPSSKELDLTDQAAVEKYVESNDIDVVVHAATWNATANTTKDTHQVLEKNLAMFFNLARLKDRYDRMIYFGSGAEYDRRHYVPFMKEDFFDVHVPQDQYGFSKYIMAKYTEGADNIVDLRVFGCFGPHEDWEIRFISNAMCKALHGLPITMRQNVLFDYMWVKDLVPITEWAILGRPNRRHYNACSGEHIDLLTLAGLVKEVTGKDVPIIIGKEGMGIEYSGDNARLKEEMGDLRVTPIKEAVQMLRDHYRECLNSIDPGLLRKDKC